MSTLPAPFFGTLLIALGVAQGLWIAFRGPAQKRDCAPITQWLPRVLLTIVYLAIFLYAWYETFVHDAYGYTLISVACMFAGQGVWELRRRVMRFSNAGSLFLAGSLFVSGVEGVAKLHSLALVICGSALLACALAAWFLYFMTAAGAAKAQR